MSMFSPDGSRVADKLVCPTHRSGRRDRRFAGAVEGNEGSARSAAFSPDGTRILTASDDNTARIWDAATGAKLQR